MTMRDSEQLGIETVNDFATKLSRNLVLVKERQYRNKSGQVGYTVVYKDSFRHYQISVSNTDLPFALDEIVAALVAFDRKIQREYPYLNRRQSIGFEATVWSSGHAFMLTAAAACP